MAGKLQTAPVKKKKQAKKQKPKEKTKQTNKKKTKNSKNKERPRRLCHTLAVLSVGLRSYSCFRGGLPLRYY